MKNKSDIVEAKNNLKEYIKVICNIIFKNSCSSILKKRNNLLSKLGYPFNDNPNSLEDLAPVIVTDGDIYIDSMLWALKNKNIKNIALTGSYGSGKSSILKTFKEKHPEFEYLNISLATFDDLFGNDGTPQQQQQPVPKPENGKYDEMNKKIELSILQQMLYVEKSSKIPNSRFQKIKNLKNYSIFITSIFCLAIVLSYLFLFHNEVITKLNCVKFYFFESENCELNFKFFEILSILFLLFGAFYVIKLFVMTISDSKFNKINFKGEVELNREVSDNSILNKNLDEIIYFFERTKYNVVVIEDLDRFNEPEIFTKLREINLLLNISKQVNRHIVFVYALKDEMFKNGDRTKFFDFILPIIPIINSSNSFDFLNEKLKVGNIDKNLLYDISLYIDDMRLLKNIVNEYKIYFDKLTKETKIQLITNKLLSFIIYKNLFPKDFAILHKNEGMIYEAFNKDLKTIKEKQTDIEEQKIIENNTEIKRLKKIVDDKTKIDNIKDLRRLYVLQLLKELPSETISFVLNKNTYFLNQIDNLIQDDIFDEIRKTETISSTKIILDPRYHRLNNILTEINISFEKIEKKVDPKYNYNQRVKLIFEKENKEIEMLNDLIQVSKEEINKIKGYNLQELLIKNKNSEEELNVEIKKSDVLIYFINNGFIAEDYFDYISIFKEGDITRNDKNFILSIRNNNALPVDYKLDKIDNLFRHLINDLYKNEILNIDLIDHLLEKENENCAEIFSQFNDENKRTIEFIEFYIKTGKQIEKFVKIICNKFFSFWSFIEKSNLTIDAKDLVLKNLLVKVSFDELVNQNKDEKLSNYISQKGDFLNLIDFENKNVEKNLLELNVKFKVPLDIKNNKSLFNFIYKNNLYQLNKEMIEQVIIENNLSENSAIWNLRNSNYTTIQDSECVDLIKYVDTEIVDYIKNVFLKLETNTEESEKYLISLINNPKLNDEEELYDIIKNQSVIFENIVDIKRPESWINLFSLNKIKPTWLNVFRYYEKHNFDEFLISYLNIEKNYLELSKSDINLGIVKDIEDEFITNLILTNEISNPSYSFLINKIEKNYNNLKIENIEEEKIRLIVEKGIISLTKENFESLRMYSLGKQVLLVKLNFDDYIEQRDVENIDYELEEKEYELLLDSDLSLTYKVKLISELSEDKINEKNNLGNLVGNILKDFRLITFSFSYLKKLLKNIKSIDTKVKLCNVYFDLISKDVANIEEILIILNQPFTNIIGTGSNKPPIEYNIANLTFIENLKRAKFIISYSSKDNKITKIRRK